MNRFNPMARRTAALLVGVLAGGLLAGCVGVSQQMPAPFVTPQVGLANPASVYCQEQGGQVEIRTDASGGQFGVCLFPDGSECDEWAYFRGECQPGASVEATSEPEVANPAAAYCVQHGGQSKILSDAAGNQTGMCVFPDGSRCDEWAFYRGECGPASQPAPEAVLQELLAVIQLPADAYSGGLAVLPLQTPVDSPPLWALYSTGMRNHEQDPAPSHFVAIFTRNDDGWQELARIDLDAQPVDDTLLMEPLPDYIDASGLQQVEIDPSRIWLTVDGGVGAHSGTFQVLSFDGETLALELASSSASPGAGYLADLNGDGQNDVALNATEYYVFCYACGVRHPDFSVYTWREGQMQPVDIGALDESLAGTPVDAANSRALELAGAGLWLDALTSIDEAVTLAGNDDPPTASGSLRWNQALIQLNTDAQLAALNESSYPLLSNVFLGDYAAAVDLMRALPVDEIFSADTPLVVGTVAEGWEPELSGYLTQLASAALEVEPELAPAWFVRAWGRYLADPADPAIAADLAQAAELAPDDPLFAAAAGL